MKAYLVTEEVLTAVVNFIGSKHTYVEAKPFIDALKSSQTGEITTTPAPSEVVKAPVDETPEPPVPLAEVGKA